VISSSSYEPLRASLEVATTDAASRAAPRRLRVSIDVLNLRSEQSGLRTYTLGLLRALGRVEGVEVHAITGAPDALGNARGVLVHRVDASLESVIRRAVWRERHLPALVRAIASDVHLALVPELPFRQLGRPSVVVIHDLGPIVSPTLYGVRRAARQAVAFRHAVHRADRVVCVSSTTRDALVKKLGVDPERCRVIGEGPQVVAAGRHPDGFALYVGSLHRHKNVETLVRAFADSRLPHELRLVMVGPSANQERERILKLADSLGISERIHHRGFVEPTELAELYASATLVVLPSLHEGFGLTILEAMCSCVPVVTSDLMSVREIAGDSVEYVSRPRSPAMWADAIARVANEPAAAEKIARAAARVRAAFSWDAAATRFIELLQETS
jgi:glycosyltransferase involved in cell wall biosynthesis